MIFKFENKDGILYAYFPEALNEADFRKLANEIENIEKENTFLMNRLVNLCNVKSFSVQFDAILSFAEKRNRKVFHNSFKTALLVSNNYQMGFGRMYQTFIQNPQMTIEIFTDELKALEWLR
jgi:hypothetical protein